MRTLFVLATALPLCAALCQAKQGFYLGVGFAQQTVTGQVDGTHSFTDPSGSPVFYDGKLDKGHTGTAATVGYGLNRFFALEYLYAYTPHNASSQVAPVQSSADFIAQTYGIRLTAPMGASAELFARAAYGQYELSYGNFSTFGAGLSQSGKVTFQGTGTAYGAGLEIFFAKLGVGLGYTQHDFVLDQAKPSGGQRVAISPKLSAQASTTDLLLTLHF